MRKVPDQALSLVLCHWEWATSRCTEVWSSRRAKSRDFDITAAYFGGPGSISMPWLCGFAFLTGIGGCGAFAGAVKTCKVGSSPRSLEAHLFSCSKLARQSWNCNRLSPIGVWSECLLFRIDIVVGFPRQYFKPTALVSCRYIHDPLRWKLPSSRCATPTVVRPSAWLTRTKQF